MCLVWGGGGVGKEIRGEGKRNKGEGVVEADRGKGGLK